MRAAFFDLDKTVIAKSALVALGPEFHARGLLPRRILIQAGLNQLLFNFVGADEAKLKKIRQQVLRITKGWDRDEVRALVKETINEVFEPLIYAEALELIDYHREQGDEVWLVSMAPAEIVEPFAELLELTGAISSRARVDAKGKFTGKLEFLAQGENKATAIRELAVERGINLDESFAYSDSATDVSMLQSVGHAFAVNPERSLARSAHENQWPIVRCRHPVRPHDRSRTRTPLVLSVVAIAVVALFGRSRRRG